MAKLMEKASKMKQMSMGARKGPSSKNIQSSRRPRPTGAPGQASTAPLKGPDQGTG